MGALILLSSNMALANTAKESPMMRTIKSLGNNLTEGTNVLIIVAFFAAFVLVIMACSDMYKISKNQGGGQGPNWASVGIKFFIAAVLAGIVGIVYWLKNSINDGDEADNLKYDRLKFGTGAGRN